MAKKNSFFQPRLVILAKWKKQILNIKFIYFMSKDVRGSLKNFQVRNILYDETKRGPTDIWEKIA